MVVQRERDKHQLSAERKGESCLAAHPLWSLQMQHSTSWHMCTESSERKGEMRVLVNLSVDVFISSLSCGNDLALTNNDDNNHNTHTTVKSVTHSELFLLYFHLDSHRFLVNFTSKTSAYLNPAKKNEKNCLL